MKKNLLLLLPITLFLFSCETEGPIGPAGPAGKDGTNGIDGTDGNDGNANVVSKNYTVSPNDWIEHGVLGIDQYYDVKIDIPEITSEIIEKGVVLVYLNVSGTYYPLPITSPNGVDIGDEQYQWLSLIDYVFKVGSVTIMYGSSDFMNDPIENYLEFKIVIIEGIALKSLSIDFTNYQDVKEQLINNNNNF